MRQTPGGCLPQHTTPAAKDTRRRQYSGRPISLLSSATSVLCPESVSAIRFFGTLDGFKER